MSGELRSKMLSRLDLDCVDRYRIGLKRYWGLFSFAHATKHL